MALLNFDASQVAPNEGQLDPIPTSWQNAQLVESEIAPTKAGDGRLLNLKFSILDGQYANRKIYTRLNIVNGNPVAQEIARGQLSALCHACGVIQVADSAQLHGIPLKIRVKYVGAKDGYDAKNEVVAFKNINEVVDMAIQGAPAGVNLAANPFAQAPKAPQQAPQQMPPAFTQPQAGPGAFQAPPVQPWQQPVAAPQTTAFPVQNPMGQPAVQTAPAPFAQAPQPAPTAVSNGPLSQNTTSAPSQVSQVAPQQPPWATAIPQQAPAEVPQQAAAQAVPGAPAEAVQQTQAAVPPWLKPAA